jgi:hypothetical protein
MSAPGTLSLLRARPHDAEHTLNQQRRGADGEERDQAVLKQKVHDYWMPAARRPW